MIDLTDSQRILIAWSSLYESINEHPECHDTFVIEDNDMLDGWLILQRKGKGNGRDPDGFIENEKIKNAQEIFIPAETLEDAKRIHGMNSEYNEAMRKKKMKIMAAMGIPILF